MPGKVAVKSLGQDGRAELYKPNKEHDRQGQASSNKLPTGMEPIACQHIHRAPNKPKAQQTETLQSSAGGSRPLQVWRPPPGGRQLRRATFPMPSVGSGTGCAAVSYL